MQESTPLAERFTGPVAQAGQCLLFLFRMLAGIGVPT